MLCQHCNDFHGNPYCSFCSILHSEEYRSIKDLPFSEIINMTNNKYVSTYIGENIIDVFIYYLRLSGIKNYIIIDNEKQYKIVLDELFNHIEDVNLFINILQGGGVLPKIFFTGKYAEIFFTHLNDKMPDKAWIFEHISSSFIIDSWNCKVGQIYFCYYGHIKKNEQCLTSLFDIWDKHYHIPTVPTISTGITFVNKIVKCPHICPKCDYEINDIRYSKQCNNCFTIYHDYCLESEKNIHYTKSCDTCLSYETKSSNNVGKNFNERNK